MQILITMQIPSPPNLANAHVLLKMSITDTFRELQSNKENFRCVDCGRNGAQWASVSNAVFICLECSGRHRGLGVHISFVRSITMDSWSVAQLTMMQIGGNKRFKDFIQSFDFPEDVSIQAKYYSKAAEYYRELIKSESENRQMTRPPPSATEGLESCVKVQEPKAYKSVENRAEEPQAQGSWWGGASSLFGSAIGKAGQWASNAAETVKEGKIVESLKSGASSVIEKSKNVRGKVAETVNAEKLKNISEKGFEVIGNVGRFAYGGMQTAYEKVVVGNNEEEKTEQAEEERKPVYQYKGKDD